MGLELHEVATGQPGTCVFCAGATGPFVTDPTIDINWGDDIYICGECTDLICELRGRVTREVLAELRSLHTKTLDQFHELEKENKMLKDRIDRMLDGARAHREAKAGQKKVRS